MAIRRHSSLSASAIPENCAFLAKFPERSSPMTNEKFSIHIQHFGCGFPRCVFATLRWNVSSIREIRKIRGAILLVAAGRVEPFAPFCGNSAQVTYYQQLTTKIEYFQLRSIKAN
jgi:hypothetical protein